MADIAGSILKMNDVEVAGDAAHSTALMTKLAANINALIDILPPVGAIMPWLGGYFADGSNGSFSMVLAAGNTVAQVNTFLPANWRVCDGTAPDDAESPIFDSSTKYLPNLTNGRFIRGDTTGGGIGGESTLQDHTHSGGTLRARLTIPLAGPAGDRDRIYYQEAATGGWNATHRTAQIYEPSGAGNLDPLSFGIVVAGTSGGMDSAPVTNEPPYLNVYYIIRIK